MGKDSSTFEGFNVLGDMLLGSNDPMNNSSGGVSSNNPIDEPLVEDPILDPSEVTPPEGDASSKEGSPKGESTNSDGNTEPTSVTDPSKIAEPTPDSTKEKGESIDLTEEEPLFTEYLQTKLFEKFGWDLDEESKLESVDDLATLLQDVVEEQSKPVYASDELAKLDEYVRNGGQLEKYFDQKYSGNVDFEKINIEESANQTLILREYFKRQGISSENIEKRIQRYEETGILEEEAKVANDLLVKSIKKETETLLAEQQKMREAIQERQQKYINDVTSTIRNTKEILPGASLTQAEEQKLLDYMFKVGQDGTTQFQREGGQSYLPLVRAAYLSMTGDRLGTKINNAAATNAAKKIKERLAVKTKRNKGTSFSTGQNNDKDYSMLASIGTKLGV